MAIIHTSTHIHWNYFIALEQDLDRLARFVDLTAPNEKTFSIEIGRLFLNASSEVDVVLKQIVRKYNAASSADKIGACLPEITQRFSDFIGFEVTVPRYGLSLHPWIDWSASSPPIWWQHHNKVKHQRDQHFDKATVKNCVNAVAGLFVAVLYLYQQEASNGGLLLLPTLLNVGDQHFGGTQIGRYGLSFKYNVR